MKKTLKKFLITMISVAMIFTMTAVPVYADDTVPAADEVTVSDNFAVDEELSGADVSEADVQYVEAEEPDPDPVPAEETEITDEQTAVQEEEPAEGQEQTAISVDVPAAVEEQPAQDDINADVKPEPEKVSEIDSVKEMISRLPNCSDVTPADREQIEAAQAAYDALSAEDQATLDTEVGTYAYNTGQPYGRVLESALWGLWSYNAIDNTTTLADGTYDPTTTPALSSEYSKGKSTSSRQKPWSVKSVEVIDGVSTATITVESDSYSDIWMGGVTYHRANSSGEAVFTGVPIDLNSTFYFAGVSDSMPVPIAFSLTTWIDGESGDDPAEEEADYSAVDAAIASIPEDLSIYTEESVQALTDAVNAVVRGKKASEQAEVDAMAQAILDAIAALVEKDTAPEKIDLTITNKTGMFKAVSAYLLKEDGKEYLVVALSATGYHELFKGTYEAAVANGDGSRENGNDKWIHGYLNSAGKWEFRIPLEKGESYIPCVAISNSYYEQYLSGKEVLERGFFPRQMKIDRQAATLETDDYNETKDFSVTSNVVDFKTADTAVTRVVGGPNSNNYSVSPTLVMLDDTYDEVIYPTVVNGKISTASAELKDGKFEISLLNAPGKEAFKDKTPIEMTFHVSENADFKAAGKYVVRSVTIDKMAGTIVISGKALEKKDSDQDDDTVVPDPPKPPTPGEDDDDSDSSGGSGYAPAVDSSTTLADGEYTPDSFSWSGGTGKLTITCTKITVINGQAYATIVFSSSKVDQLKASGGLYYKQGSGNSVFVIPVNLNANNLIIARTTAMSQPHWIEYVIYIGLAENEEQAEKAKAAKKDAAEAKMKISEEAPAIIGLEASDEESVVEYSKYFKIFNYEHGVKMLSIDISTKTALKEEYTENAKKALEASKSEEEAVEYDEEGKIITKSKTEYIEALYKNNVVNYLLVPEDYEVPAGLDKEYIIVTIPAEKSFAASEEAIAMLEDLGMLDAISLLGIDEENIKSDELRKAVEEEKTLLAGNLEKPDYAKVVKDKSGLAILPGDILPEEIDKDAKEKDKEKLAEEAEAKKENLEKLESRFSALGVPVIIDRSAQEEDELAQAEWIKVYGALFGCDEAAEKIFEEKVKEAKKNGKN